jgi:hypothetical protein
VWGDGVDRFDGLNWTNSRPSNTVPPGDCSGGCGSMLFCPPEELGLISVFVDVLGVDPVTGNVWFRNEDDGPCVRNGTTVFDGTTWRTTPIRTATSQATT